jgi:hypothetical protein
MLPTAPMEDTDVADADGAGPSTLSVRTRKWWVVCVSAGAALKPRTTRPVGWR